MPTISNQSTVQIPGLRVRGRKNRIRTAVKRLTLSRDLQPWISKIDRLQTGFRLTQIELATRVLHCAPRSLVLWKKHREPGRATLVRLNELDRLYHALTLIMPPEDIGPWMNRTNDYIQPFTPLEIIDRGEIDRLWQIIHNVGTGMPT